MVHLLLQSNSLPTPVPVGALAPTMLIHATVTKRKRPGESGPPLPRGLMGLLSRKPHSPPHPLPSPADSQTDTSNPNIFFMPFWKPGSTLQTSPNNTNLANIKEREHSKTASRPDKYPQKTVWSQNCMLCWNPPTYWTTCNSKSKERKGLPSGWFTEHCSESWKEATEPTPLLTQG